MNCSTCWSTKLSCFSQQNNNQGEKNKHGRSNLRALFHRRPARNQYR